MTLHQIVSPARQNVRSLALDLSWWLWFIAIGALYLMGITQSLPVIVFMAGSLIYVLARPGLAIKAIFSAWVPWIYVIFAALSVLWSQFPDWTLRASIQYIFSTGAFLVMVRALPAKSFLTVFLSALLVADAASLANPIMALNTQGWAMIGIFGSKNFFGLMQAFLIQFSVWVLLDRTQPRLLRGLAAIGVVGGAFLITAALAVGASVALFGALACAFLAFSLRPFPPRSRIIILCAGGLVIAILCGFLIVFSDELFQAALQFTGKSSSLSERTSLWDVAKKTMEIYPIGGFGFQAFWQHGNPYAEDVWRRFKPGINFHNLWYESVVELGYIGLSLAILTVAITAIEVMRWVLRSPSPTSCFFFGFVVFIILHSPFEVELFAQFSPIGAIFLAAFVYARQSREQHEVQQRGCRPHTQVL
jgi:exopolysaccharide production protein ExoQ